MEFITGIFGIPGENEGGLTKTYTLFKKIYSVQPISRHGDGVGRYSYSLSTNGVNTVSVAVLATSASHSSQLFIYGKWS